MRVEIELDKLGDGIKGNQVKESRQNAYKLLELEKEKRLKRGRSQAAIFCTFPSKGEPKFSNIDYESSIFDQLRVGKN